jgi:alpha-glucosidase (family GH31 glycosyl hydrolase)
MSGMPDIRRPTRLTLFASLLLLSPLAARAAGPVVVASARFTVLTPNCVRLEYSPAGHFVDDPSYFAATRPPRAAEAKVTTDGQTTTIDTGAMRLTYRPDGKPFSADNLTVVVAHGTSWRPGQVNAGNLGGTERTLDGWDGARKLSDGLLSRDGWALVDDSTGPLLTADWVKARPADAGTDWYLFGYGDDYRAALRSLTTVSGPVPMPRRYELGAWYSRYWPYSSAEFRQIVQQYADHGFPLDVLVMDMDWHLDGWTGYTWNPKLLPDHQALLDWVHAHGLAVTLNDHPATGVGKQEAMYGDFMRAMGKDPATDKPLPFDAGDKKYLDTFYAYTHRPLEDQGVDFWWLDWQQYPFTKSVPTLTNLQWLNHYNYQETARDGKRGVSFSRWGGWGSQRYPIQFSGDASTAFRMLAFEVPFTAAAGNVGCFFWSHDIGGHNRGRNEESYARWCQFGAFSAALRSHSTRDATMDRRPWTYPAWAEDSMRASFQLRSRFFPYLYTAMHAATADSVPFIRPVYLDRPTVETAYHQPQEYQFGDDVLVAPIAEAGAGPNRLGRQTVWFPPGATWYDFFTGEPSDGGRQALVAAPIDQFPLYLRGGVPVAMRPFTQRMATEPLTDLVVRSYPGPDGVDGSSTLYEDDGLTTAYQTGAAATTKLTYGRRGSQVTITVAPTAGTFHGQPEERAITIELPAVTAATRVMMDGVPASAEYDAAERMNRIRVPARSIRTGCVVTLTTDAIPADTLHNGAFARRAGLPHGDAPLTELLAAALDKATDDRDRAAVCAAAGVGVFPRVESIYGFPATATDQTFVRPDVPAQVEPQPAAADDTSAVQTDRFRVTLAGRSFTATSASGPVDWAHRPGNIAPTAHVTVSSGEPVKGLIDGRVGGYPGDRTAEWATRGEHAGAWAKLAWATPQTVDRVVLFDRPNPDDHVTGGTIEFSDGSHVAFGPLDNDAGRGTDVRFPARAVTSLKITVTGVSAETVNIGLSEVAVFRADPAK